MTSALAVATTSACISLIAATIAGIALWKTHLSGFRPIVVVGDLSRRLFPIRSENERWYMASFAFPVSVTNGGARAGIIRGMRLALHYPKLPIPDNSETFSAKWEVLPGSFQRDARERFAWLDDAVVGDWMAQVVLPQETLTKHFVFETRWDTPVIQDLVQCRLEILHDRGNEWRVVATWEFEMSAITWSELSEIGTCMSVAPKGAPHHIRETQPADLHKYTGTRDKLPSGGFQAPASYLDFPTSEGRHEKA